MPPGFSEVYEMLAGTYIYANLGLNELTIIPANSSSFTELNDQELVNEKHHFQSLSQVSDAAMTLK